MSFGFLVTAVAATTLGGPFVGPQTARDQILVTRAPYPPNRTDSPARIQNGRLWVSQMPIGTRTPIAQQVVAEPGPASYGAPWSPDQGAIFVRVNHVPIAIDPWGRIQQSGLEHFEIARQAWLHEQGYILKVRTHTNARYQGAAARSMYSQLPEPRAILRVNDELPRRPSRLRVMGPATVLPLEEGPTAAAAE